MNKLYISYSRLNPFDFDPKKVTDGCTGKSGLDVHHRVERENSTEPDLAQLVQIQMKNRSALKINYHSKLRLIRTKRG